MAASGDDLATRLLAGDRAALARAMTWVEAEDPRGDAVLAACWPEVGDATRLGVTGPPGVGKSTLVATLVRRRRAAGERVGVVAVDPSSPFTGGALLGDRIRMAGVADDPGVFIRSMASRGHAGGLAAAAQDVADLLDAAGHACVVLETVGVGQLEIEVATAADTTLVVLSPESGDGIQAMKAGLMEVADVCVVNKADRDGAERLAADLGQAMDLLTGPADRWRPPIVKAIATREEGGDEVWRAVEAHRAWLATGGRGAAARRTRLTARIRGLVRRRLEREAWARPGMDAALAARVEAVVAGRESPRAAAAALVGR